MTARGLFVTGTDTGVGKTLVSAALLHGMASRGARVAAMKPVASGCTPTPAGLRSDDALLLARHATVAAQYAQINPYALEPPIAPHIAAAAAGARIDIAAIAQAYTALAARADCIVVEGVGGWRVPLNEREEVADLAWALRLPVLLVVGVRLGCLNHALLTAEAIVQSGSPFAGWVASCIDPQMPALRENLEALSQRLPGPHLGTLPYGASDLAHAARGLERALALLA